EKIERRMFKVIDVSIDTDLSQFSRLLWQRKIGHRIQTVDGRQVLVMTTPQLIPQTVELYQQWQRGEVQPEEDHSSSLGDVFNAGELGAGIRRAFSRGPLTLLLIAVCCALAFFAPLVTPTELTFSLLYPDFSYGTRTIVLQRVLENFSV